MTASRRKLAAETQPIYLETNVPGMFAAGDVRHGSVKRCASAVGEGADVGDVCTPVFGGGMRAVIFRLPFAAF